VSFSYNSLAPVLNNVSSTCSRGTGCTAGRLGQRQNDHRQPDVPFYDITAGSITIDGTDIRDVTLASLRRTWASRSRTSSCTRAPFATNIAYGAPQATTEEVIAAAKAAQIHDFIQGLPDGYETWVGERGVTLSGGENSASPSPARC